MQSKSELSEQQAVMEWAEWECGKYPELCLLYHIPNERKCSAVTGANLKRAGVKKGVPDLCLPCAKGKYNALYIEMKKDSKGEVSAAQKQWIEKLNAAGNLAVVCRSADYSNKLFKTIFK